MKRQSKTTIINQYRTTLRGAGQQIIESGSAKEGKEADTISAQCSYTVPKVATLLRVRHEFTNCAGGRTYIFVAYKAGLAIEMFGDIKGIEEHGDFQMKCRNKDEAVDAMWKAKAHLLQKGYLDLRKFKVEGWEQVKPKKVQVPARRKPTEPPANWMPTLKQREEAKQRREVAKAALEAKVDRLQPIPLFQITDDASPRMAVIVEKIGMTDPNLPSNLYDLVMGALRIYERREPAAVCDMRHKLAAEIDAKRRTCKARKSRLKVANKGGKLTITFSL